MPDRKTALIVEDDWPSRTGLSGVLRFLGWNVLRAECVAEGIRAMRAKPDVLIVDLMLPDGDGATVITAARKSGVKCVIVTSGTAQSSRLDISADHYLVKPISLSRLQEILEAIPQ